MELRNPPDFTGFYNYDGEDNRTPEEHEADLAAEVEKRVREAQTGPTYTHAEVWG